MPKSNYVYGLIIATALGGLVFLMQMIVVKSVELKQAAECVNTYVKQGTPRDQIEIQGNTCKLKNRASLFDSNTD